MFYIRKTFSISACHKLRLPYKSKCSNLHGHNWKITIYARSLVLDKNGMVVDFSEVKRIITDALDHKHLNRVIKQPTAERIAYWILNTLNKKLPEVQPNGRYVYRVDVEESDGSIATHQEWYHDLEDR